MTGKWVIQSTLFHQQSAARLQTSFPADH